MIETKVELITPEMAKVYLERNTKNRRLEGRVVDRYASDMVAGRFDLTHQGIGFYETGDLADGQHRLSAIVKANVPVRMMVTRGLKKESVTQIDSHKARSLVDSFSIQSGTNRIAGCDAKKAFAIVRTSAEVQSAHGAYQSYQTSIDLCNAHTDGLAFVSAYASKRERIINQGAILAAIFSAYYFVETSKLKRFCDVLFGFEDPVDDFDQPAIRFRCQVLACRSASGRNERKIVFGKTQRAIKAAIEGEKIKVIRDGGVIWPAPLANVRGI
ncbi:MAG: hypothetical protein RLZZ396_2101 [Planctomycetota bacterium]|jgi:hypothetical protein